MVLLHTITHSSRIHDILYCRRNEHEKAGQLLLVGAEDRKVSVYRINADSSARLPRVVAEMVGHTNRFVVGLHKPFFFFFFFFVD